MAKCIHTEASDASDVSRLHLLELGPDVLGVLIDGIADPLHPELPVALSRTCKPLSKLLRATLARLEKENKQAAQQWCARFGEPMRIFNVDCLRSTTKLDFPDRRRTHPGRVRLMERVFLASHDLAVLGMLLRTRRIPKLLKLDLQDHIAKDTNADVAVQSLFDNLGAEGTPCLQILSLYSNGIGPLGAMAFAASLSRGAAQKLTTLDLGNNALRNRGISALAAPLRKLPALRKLGLAKCAIGDAGIGQLMADLCPEEFPVLLELMLDFNLLTCAGFANVSAALNRREDLGAVAGVPRVVKPALPRLEHLYVRCNHAFPAAVDDVQDALSRRGLESFRDFATDKCPPNSYSYSYRGALVL